MMPPAPALTVLCHPARRYCDVMTHATVPCLAAVNAVRVCPYNPALFATAGFDGAVKVFYFRAYFIHSYLFLMQMSLVFKIMLKFIINLVLFL
jgi:hypothetical protein